jgi:hypothetical protein
VEENPVAYGRYNPFQQLVSYDAGWICGQLGGSGPNALGWYHCPCPVHHGDSPTALGLRNASSGQLIVKCFHGCSHADIHRSFDHLAASVSTFSRPAQREAVRVDAIEAAKASTEQAARIWHRSGFDERIAVYLRARRITLTPPADLRVHPDLHHRSGTCSPALVAFVRDVEGKPLAIHRTWLTADGSAKAAVNPNKMTLGPMTSGAVRLAACTDSILLAEGIETTLSAMQLTGLPGWSTLHTSGLQAVQLPPEIRTVTIAADHDTPGLAAAQALCARLEGEGRSVTMIRPNKEGDDFNDVLGCDQ